MKVKFFSGFLWSYGYEEAYKNFIEWFEQLIPVNANRVSRVDIACDVDEFQFAQSDLNNFVTRARNKRINSPEADALDHDGKCFSGFTFGKGKPLLCRIYNKTIEIRHSKKKWFNTIYMQNGSDLYSDIWRIEFQIKREFLKETGVSSMTEFIDKKSNIWAYLTEEWLILKNPDDNNKTRRSIDKNWCSVQQSAKDYYASPVIRNEIIVQNAQGLLDQIAGCTVSLSAILDYPDVEYAMKIITIYMTNKFEQNGTSFIHEKEKKSSKHL
ncbi:MAG: replication initiation factor [Desulfosporosinus sp.]|nr:replication initiation factor [Desulfosporosinus sp.]